jgi:hypothetical protein
LLKSTPCRQSILNLPNVIALSPILLINSYI